MSSALREPLPPLNPVRWTVEEYFRLSEAGVLEDRRVELLDGEIIEKAAQATPHRASVTKIIPLLFRTFPPPSQWVVVQGTLVLSACDALDPDFHVLDAAVGTPDEKLPAPLLVMEVSDTTYRKDSGPKLRTYARCGVSDYWIVNIPKQRVEVYRTPENPTGDADGWRYASSSFFTREQQVQMLARPDVRFDVEALLP